MDLAARTRRRAFWSVLVVPICSAAALATPTPPASAAARPASVRGGPHDFDFEFGAWTVRLDRLVHPLSGSHTWVHYTGTSVVRRLWDGRANVGELEIDDSASHRHLEALSFRLFNPTTSQWNVYFANAAVGTLGVPTVGGFHDGRGEFFDREPFEGRTILVRFIFSDITANSFRFVQAFSADGGRTWEANWTASFTRAPRAGPGG